MHTDLIVNAGGASRRMGIAKALLPVPSDGKPLLRHIIKRLSGLISGQTIVVANDPTLVTTAGLAPSVRQVGDRYPDAGALGGLATGLALCSDWAIAVACDLPLVNPRLFAALVTLTQGSADESPTTDGGQPWDALQWDAIVPVTDGYPQPLHALYHRRCLPAMEALIEEGNLRIVDLYNTVRVHYVPESTLRRYDPDLLSFFNVNTPEEWRQALAILEGLD